MWVHGCCCGTALLVEPAASSTRGCVTVLLVKPAASHKRASLTRASLDVPAARAPAPISSPTERADAKLLKNSHSTLWGAVASPAVTSCSS